ncbi:MAG: PPOX class F420-dependent oxidoreductase [Acidimicrobiia bacterium]
MGANITLLREPHIAVLSTVMADGSPHSTPVWVDTDGDDVLFNIVKGRQKHRNLERDGRVSVTVVDPANPYRVFVARGRAALVDEGADDHIDALSLKYLGLAKYPMHRPGWERVIVRMTITSKFDFNASRTPEEWKGLGRRDIPQSGGGEVAGAGDGQV